MQKKSLEIIDIKSWKESISPALQDKAVQALENGKILYFPHLPFSMSQEESFFFNPNLVDPKAKNISYDPKKDQLGKVLCTGEKAKQLKEMMQRYAATSRQFLEALIPHYKSTLVQARTSFRPVEIFGRKSSYRKDDTRLHVDAFPSSPVKGNRLLRLFTNVNPEGKPRVWRAGEPFADVVNKIAPRVAGPKPLVAKLLNFLKVTKDLRTSYDHYMLQIHDEMKRDMEYQRVVPQEEIRFPPGSSWLVYTDQVSHAAMAGQHVFEQTFYLPVNGLKNRATSPLACLEKYYHQSLV
jgi:3-deoxy-D-manno-oct-2-ulosonic acid (Kdo) hydroxylase